MCVWVKFYFLRKGFKNADSFIYFAFDIKLILEDFLKGIKGGGGQGWGGMGDIYNTELNLLRKYYTDILDVLLLSVLLCSG